jgi:hypothetical protein
MPETERESKYRSLFSTGSGTSGADPDGAAPGGVDPGGASTGRVEPGGAEPPVYSPIVRGCL